MANKLYESGWRTPAGTLVSGTVTLTAPTNRAAGSGTLSTVPEPVAVTAGAFEVVDLPAGPYEVMLELVAGEDETRINTDRGPYRIEVDAAGDQRLRDLL